MIELWESLSAFLIAVLVVINQIVTAGVAITTLSLLIYTLTFNLADRVARSFTLLLGAITVVFATDLLALLVTGPDQTELWLRIQWLGIAFLPAILLDFSDALLATTGRPSRGRRRSLIRIYYTFAAILFMLVAFTDSTVRAVVIGNQYSLMQAGWLFGPFTVFFVVSMGLGLYNIYRAYTRCLTRVTRNRMGFLLVASVAPGLGVFPYLMLTGGLLPSIAIQLLFWISAIGGNLVVGTLLVVMAYSVAFFGAPQPDRVIKARLFAWLLRGPMVTSSVVAATVLARRMAMFFDIPQTVIVPLVLVATMLVLQFGITVLRQPLERLLFYGSSIDRRDVRRLQLLSERLLTAGDVEEFLESVLAAACDVLRVPSGFIASVGAAQVRFEVRIGPDQPPHEQTDTLPDLPDNQVHPQAIDSTASLFEWQGFWVIPLNATSEALVDPETKQGQVIGLMGLKAPAAPPDLLDEQYETLNLLVSHAASALEDRRLQRKVLTALDELLPQVEELQRLRAAARYSATKALTTDEIVNDPDLTRWVKAALSHYWGGPRLMDSPLLQLRVVAQAQVEANNDNPVNALRLVLRQAIEQVRPAGGQRKFTTEWLLYNILEMKFLQNRRVRDIALRLSMSEADLYRKQRIAIDQVARIITDMEREVVE